MTKPSATDLPHPTPARAQDQDELLSRSLASLFGDIDPAALALLRQQLEWVEVAGGQALMQQGEPGDAMFLVISGRLRAYVPGDDGAPRLLREMARGQVIGELSLITDAPRSATVIALRDSVLVRLGKPAFMHLLAGSGELALAMTRQIVRRMQTAQPQPHAIAPVTMALVPISDGVDAAALARELAQALAGTARVRVLDAAAVDELLQLPGGARADTGDAAANRRIALLLDHLEAQVDHLLLVADTTPTAWTQRCARQADELLLLADATRPPQLHPNETGCLMQRPAGSAALEVLLLLHPDVRAQPHGTQGWLARRALADHVHLRRGHAGDLARLARLQTRTAVGLVLAGGGARGLAHLGVWRALRERGIDIDVVGGTSIGGVMAALVASDKPYEQVLAVARREFLRNPTGDFNLLPLISLIRGRRMKNIIDGAVRELLGGPPPDIVDLWKGYFCIAANYSKARQEVLRRGPLAKLIRAGVSIPGALPPVLHEGDLLCDGGTFNNFPVDVMRGMRGVGRVIGVDLAPGTARPLAFDEVPGPWALLRDRLRPRAQRRYRMPTLATYLLNVTILYSSSRQRQAREQSDVYLHPPLLRVGMLQWSRFDAIVRQGHAYAVKALDEAAAPS